MMFQNPDIKPISCRDYHCGSQALTQSMASTRLPAFICGSISPAGEQIAHMRAVCLLLSLSASRSAHDCHLHQAQLGHAVV